MSNTKTKDLPLLPVGELSAVNVVLLIADKLKLLML
jgi:hypothetical protein